MQRAKFAVNLLWGGRFAPTLVGVAAIDSPNVSNSLCHCSGDKPRPPPMMPLGGDSRNVPVYVLFLIMLSSGIVTLLILWGCIQYINHKRRFNAAANGDIERNGMARGSLEEGHVASRNEYPQQPRNTSSSAKHQESGAQLTYVVMAGEDKPTFLALPSTKTFMADPSPQSTEMATMKIEK